MDGYHWLLALHVSGAFLLLGGTVLAGAFNVAALRSERPSDVALFLGLTRVAVAAIGVGSLLVLVLGLWLVGDRDYSFGDAWIPLSLALFVAGMGGGQMGGRRDNHTRLLAERLAAESDVATAELRARMRDPVTITLSWGSAVAMVAVLALMIWKPGS